MIGIPRSSRHPARFQRRRPIRLSASSPGWRAGACRFTPERLGPHHNAAHQIHRPVRTFCDAAIVAPCGPLGTPLRL